MGIIESLLVTAICGLVGWGFNQSMKITRLETKQEDSDKVIGQLNGKIDADRIENSTLKTLTYSIDSKIEKKVNEATKELKDLIHELSLTLKEFTTVVGVLKEELKEVKKK